jgi:hypothetical protein
MNKLGILFWFRFFNHNKTHKVEPKITRKLNPIDIARIQKEIENMATMKRVYIFNGYVVQKECSYAVLMYNANAASNSRYVLFTLCGYFVVLDEEIHRDEKIPVALSVYNIWTRNHKDCRGCETT